MTYSDWPDTGWETWYDLDWSKVSVALLDVDGVLADTRHRDHFVQQSPKNWGGYFKDMAKDGVWGPGLALYDDLMDEGINVAYLTGRNENYRAITLEWMLDAGFGLQWDLMMRPLHNKTKLHDFKASVIRQIHYRNYPMQEPGCSWGLDYSQILVIDDDPAVIEVADTLGCQTYLTLWQPKVKELVDTKTT